MGWTEKEDRVLIRLHDDGAWLIGNGNAAEPSETIRLKLLAVPSGALVEEWEILGPEDRNDAKRRAARWKAAEEALLGLGVRIDPSLRPLPELDAAAGSGPWRFGPHTVRVEHEYMGSMNDAYNHLVLAVGGREVRIRQIGVDYWTSPVCRHKFARAWSSPSGNVLVLQDLGCHGTFDEVFATRRELDRASAP